MEMDLGVRVDRDLKFREQAATAVAKSSKVMGVIKKSFQNLDRVTLPLLFKTLVHPHLEHSNAVWGPFNQEDQIRVEHVQRRATKLVHSIMHRPYIERLWIYNLPSLYYHRKQGDMILVYQIFNAGSDVQPEIFFDRVTDHVTMTRGHQWKIKKSQTEYRIRRQAFAT